MRDFHKLSELLHRQLPASDDPPAPETAQRLLRESWRRNAEKPGLHSHPLLFASGRVAVFVESPLWASEIRHRAPTLIEALNRGGLEVHRLDIRVQPAETPQATKPRRKPRLSANNAGALEAAARQIEHPELKAAMGRLAKLARSAQSGEKED
ncbi:MAG: DciA family protein [Pseudomonadota bacterium]|nr:DciA family protein [Pseudomonadota bacterium]